MDDHIILALLLLSVIGIALGFVGTYVVGGVLLLVELAKIMFLTAPLVGGA